MSRIDEINERLAAATPGPWTEPFLNGVWYGGYDGGFVSVGPWHGMGEAACEDGCEPECEHHKQAWRDAALVMHAPSDLAWLLGEVERLRGAVYYFAYDEAPKPCGCVASCDEGCWMATLYDEMVAMHDTRNIK